MHSLPQHINTCTAVLLKTFSVISTVDLQQYIRRQFVLLSQFVIIIFLIYMYLLINVYAEFVYEHYMLK